MDNESTGDLLSWLVTAYCLLLSAYCRLPTAVCLLILVEAPGIEPGSKSQRRRTLHA